MGIFAPLPPFIGTPATTSNPNASNPLTPTTQIALQNRPVAASASTAASGGASPTPPGAGATPSQWDQYIATIQAAINASAGWERTKLEAQMEDARKGRANAYKIAELQAKTSRYGTDQQTNMQLAQLKQNQKQFEASHGLELAKAYTQFASTPDMVWSLNDFKGALGRVGQGFSPQPIAASASPTPKTYEDFAALTNYKTGDGASSGSGTADPGGRAAGGRSTTDARVTAANAVMRAIPPSETPGNDGQDWAALRAIENLYMAGRPGEVERLGAPRRKIAQAGLARLGYDPALVESDRQRALPGQGNVRAA